MWVREDQFVQASGVVRDVIGEVVVDILLEEMDDRGIVGRIIPREDLIVCLFSDCSVWLAFFGND